MDKFLKSALEYLEKSGFSLLTMIIVLILGFKIISNLTKLVKFLLLHTKIDTALVNLTITVIRLVLYLALILYSLNIMKIPLTGVVAALSALTLAVGLSIQSIISSVANSIMLVAIRPFKVGDFCDIGGTLGTIKEINLIQTIMNTPDNRRVAIPNSNVFNSIMVNYSANEIRRIDVKISVDYDADTEFARKVLLEVCQNHPMVLKTPAPQVRWNAHNDSYLEFVMRVWCDKDDFWQVTWDLDEQSCTALQKNNICIPFPQMTLSYREPTPAVETNTKEIEKDEKKSDKSDKTDKKKNTVKKGELSKATKDMLKEQNKPKNKKANIDIEDDDDDGDDADSESGDDGDDV